jgi:hypothetical protein
VYVEGERYVMDWEGLVQLPTIRREVLRWACARLQNQTLAGTPSFRRGIMHAIRTMRYWARRPEEEE